MMVLWICDLLTCRLWVWERYGTSFRALYTLYERLGELQGPWTQLESQPYDCHTVIASHGPPFVRYLQFVWRLKRIFLGFVADAAPRITFSGSWPSFTHPLIEKVHAGLVLFFVLHLGTDAAGFNCKTMMV